MLVGAHMLYTCFTLPSSGNCIYHAATGHGAWLTCPVTTYTYGASDNGDIE